MFSLSGREPIYEQLQAHIARMVVAGVMQPGEQLPSVRAMAQELGVNPNTVQKAYTELERDGIIYTLPGKGCFISGNAQSNSAISRIGEEKMRAALEEAKGYGISSKRLIELVREVYGEEDGK